MRLIDKNGKVSSDGYGAKQIGAVPFREAGLRLVLLGRITVVRRVDNPRTGFRIQDLAEDVATVIPGSGTGWRRNGMNCLQKQRGEVWREVLRNVMAIGRL